MTDLLERILNPAVVGTMVAAGIAYGGFLWALNLRPNLTLWLAAVLPGTVFILMIAVVRAAQGTPSAIWLYLLIDWLVFSSTGAITVLAWRRWRRRR